MPTALKVVVAVNVISVVAILLAGVAIGGGFVSGVFPTDEGHEISGAGREVHAREHRRAVAVGFGDVLEVDEIHGGHAARRARRGAQCRVGKRTGRPKPAWQTAARAACLSGPGGVSRLDLSEKPPLRSD